MTVKGLYRKAVNFFRAIGRMISAVARALRRAYDAVSRGISAFLVIFWRTAIILTAKFLSGASVSWVELADDSRRDDQTETAQTHQYFIVLFSFCHVK